MAYRKTLTIIVCADSGRLPVRIEKHELTKQQLLEIYGEGGWKRLPDEVFSRAGYKPSVKEVVEHHVAVYAGKFEGSA